MKIAKSVELFVMETICDLPTVKYWHGLETLWFVKKRVSQKNSELIFTSLATIGGDLSSRHPKNNNLVQKDSKDII